MGNEKEYTFGKRFAKKYFNHYLETGECSPGGGESVIYCEAVASLLRDGRLITQRSINRVARMLRAKSSDYYDGVCDFLIEKMEEFRREKRAELSEGKPGVEKILEGAGL